MNIEEKRLAVIEDAFDTCLNDRRYLMFILKDYYGDLSDDDIEKYYDDAFGDKPDWI
jgi:hypothetical protein